MSFIVLYNVRTMLIVYKKFIRYVHIIDTILKDAVTIQCAFVASFTYKPPYDPVIEIEKTLIYIYNNHAI